MAEIIRTVEIPFLNGETRTVLMSMGAKIEAEGTLRRPDGTPTPFYEIINMDGLMPLRALLYAGIRGAMRAEQRYAEAAAVTLEQVDGLLELIDSNTLAAYLIVAVSLADRVKVTDEDQAKNIRRRASETIARLGEMTTTSSAASPSDPAA